MNAVLIPAHATNYTAGRQKSIDRIVIHYTAGVGDTARNNGIFFQGANRQASAHFFVDENTVVCSVREGDTAWHAGNWDMNCRSVGIEMCSKKDAEGNYYIPKATVDRTVELTRELMDRYGIGVEGVLRHYDVNGKHCPEPFVRNGALWEDFKRRIAEEPAQEQPAAWAADAWRAAKACGVLDGTRPFDPVTRQELAVILQRMGSLN